MKVMVNTWNYSMNEKTVYEGKYITLKEQLIGDDLYEKAYIKGAVIVFAMEEDGQVYFIKEIRPHEEIKERWKPVTGFLEENLTWEENTQKELQEEIGKKADELILLGHVKNRGNVNVDKYFVLAKGLKNSKILNADDEGLILEKKLFTVDDLLKKTLSNEFYFNFDSIGIFLLKNYVDSFAQ